MLVAIRLYLRWSLTEIMETITVLQRNHLIPAFVLDLSFVCKIKVGVPYLKSSTRLLEKVRNYKGGKHCNHLTPSVYETRWDRANGMTLVVT